MKKISALLMVIVVIYSGLIVIDKYRIEKSNQQVELTVDYNSFAQFKQLDLLKEFSQNGLSSVAVTEKSLEELALESKISIYNGWQLQGLNNFAIDLNEIDVNSIYISGPSALLKQIKARFNWAGVEAIAKDQILVLDSSQVELLSKSVYFSNSAQKLIQSFNLQLIPRFKKETSLRELKETLATLKNVNTIIFSGEEIATYPKLRNLAELLRDFKINLGIVEPFLAQQLGAKELAARMNYKAVRVHSIKQAELAKLGVEKTVSRYIKAVQERNVRLLYLKPFTSRAQTKSFFHELSQELNNRGYKLKVAKPFKSVSPKKREWWLSFLALVIAIIVPTAEYIYLIQSSTQHNLVRTYGLFILVSLVSVGAGLVITALLFDSSYLLQIKQFRGVKLAFIGPLLLSSCYLLSRVKEVKHKLTSILKKSVVWWQLLLGISLLLAVIIYLGRTGNQPLIGVSNLEVLTRNFLSEIFVVRPRFKSFLIGHPLLLLGISQVTDIKYQWLLIGGLIGQINIINTLVHLHTPVDIALLRVGLGILLGAVLGGGLLKWNAS